MSFKSFFWMLSRTKWRSILKRLEWECMIGLVESKMSLRLSEYITCWRKNTQLRKKRVYPRYLSKNNNYTLVFSFSTATRHYLLCVGRQWDNIGTNVHTIHRRWLAIIKMMERFEHLRIRRPWLAIPTR